jgi:hypothetical protein
VNTFRVSIPAPPPPVDPGSATSFTVEVRNKGSIVDRYRCETVGIDPSWVEVSPDTLGLFPPSSVVQPGQATDISPSIGTFTVTVRPPRDSTAKAGTLPFGALVRSEQDPSNTLVEEGKLQILPFGDLRASLHPSVLVGRSGALTAIALANDGNRPEDVTLTASDPSGRMSFALEPPQVTVPPGERASVQVRISLGAPQVIGGTDGGPFTIEVRPKGRDVGPIVLQGVFQKRALVPRIVPSAIGGILAVALGAVLVWAAVRPPAAPTSAPSAATATPSTAPNAVPTPSPTAVPTPSPTAVPTPSPTPAPTPQLLTIPDMRCAFLGLAESDIRFYGFAVGSISGPDDPTSIVIAQDPAPGEQQAPLTPINLTVGTAC